MILAGTMVFGMLPSNAFANNEQETTSTVVDETVTTDDSAKLEEEGETNQGATEVEAPVEEALPEGDANTEVAVDLSLEEVKFEKTKEIKTGEKYIIVYDNKKALTVGNDDIIAAPIEIEGNDVKTEITQNMVWTVDENNNLKSEEGKYLSADLELQEKEGQSFKLDEKNVSYGEEPVNIYLTYNEENNQWSFEEKENEAVTYYNVVGPVETLEELTEEEIDKIEEENKPEEPTGTPVEGENPNETPQEPSETPSEGTEGSTPEGDEPSETPEDGVEDEVVADGEEEVIIGGDNDTTFAGETYKYEKVTKIDSATDKYVIVYENGDTKVALNDKGNNNNDTAVNITSRTDGYYDITNVSNIDLWTFSKEVTSSTTGVKLNNVAGKQLEINDGSISMNSTGHNIVVVPGNTFKFYYDRTGYLERENFLYYTGSKFSGERKYEYETNNSKYKMTIYKQVTNAVIPDPDPDPGEGGIADDIILNKIATNERLTSDGRGYMYDINLSVLGKEVISNNPVDITMVLDVSNSMTNGNGSNMTNTKAAAKAFIDNTLKAGNQNIRLSIVKYATTSQVYNFRTQRWINYSSVTSNGENYYTYSGQSANSVITNLAKESSDTGGTNTEAGLVAANNVTAIRNRVEAQSIVLFMTDGAPTYYIGGGTGSSVSDNTFNKAVSVGKSLSSNNTVYTIGLLAGVSGDALTAANNLLSDQYSYKRDTTNNRVTYSIDGAPYSSGYYKVTNSSTAASEMEKIYKDLASKVLALSTGTVTDIIPAEFKLTEESKTFLIEQGHSVTVNTDGTTTIVFKDVVTATSNKYDLPTFTIEPNTNAYGAKFTNVEATYDYTLYDKSTGTKKFPIPQGFITPLTDEDVYYTTVNSRLTIDDVLNNDLSFNNKLEQGYTVSDLTYRLVDQNGNSISSITGTNGESLTVGSDSKFNFISPVEGTFTFYYVAEGTASNGKVLTSAPTLVTVHVYGIENKVFVIDYGKPVTYSAETVFNKDIEKATGTIITLPESENSDSKCGTLVLNNNKSITYTLNRYMDKIDKFNFNVEIENIEQPLNKTVTIMPATTVYYEDNFGNTSDNDGSNGIVFSGNWTTEGTYVNNNQDSIQGGNYGSDNSYKDDLALSGGSSHVITVGKGQKASASFTFKGTGFDLISRTNNNTGSIIVEISKKNDDGTLTKVKKTIVNNQYKSGDLYQIPVINFYTEEYATYQVDITVGETVFYLDAIRVYNPLGLSSNDNLDFEEANTQYEKDGESNAVIKEIRNMLLSPTTSSSATIEGNDKVVFVDGNATANITDYANVGPNNEVYLANGQAIAFTVPYDDNLSTIQIGMKATNGTVIAKISGTNVTEESKTIGTATDMYYKVNKTTNDKQGYTVVITNDSNNILSITNLKLTYSNSNSTRNEFVFVDEETVVVANMLAYESNQNKSADINSDGVVDIVDLANVANNQNKEVIIGVSTDIYRQDLTGTRTINREDLNIVRDNIQ